MTQKDTGGPAFPSEGEGHGNPKYHSPGMTLRDYFAGQALIALISYRGRGPASQAALWAYEVADAMIAEREKGEPEPDNSVHFTFAGR